VLLHNKGKFDIVRIKFGCTISSKVGVIDRMKIISHPLRYMYVNRRKASVLVTPMAVHEQCNALLVCEKTVASAKLTRRVRIVIKPVHLVTYATVI